MLIPRLDDIDIFNSAPVETQQAMQECWDASMQAYDPLRDTQSCIDDEFSLMAVVYDGAFGKCSFTVLFGVQYIVINSRPNQSWNFLLSHRNLRLKK